MWDNVGWLCSYRLLVASRASNSSARLACASVGAESGVNIRRREVYTTAPSHRVPLPGTGVEFPQAPASARSSRAKGTKRKKNLLSELLHRKDP